jgi:hypothetical protein
MVGQVKSNKGVKFARTPGPKSAHESVPAAVSDECGDQKREWDGRRRRRLKALHHLYRLLDGVDRSACFYCQQRKAATLDHCPSLLMLDGLGIEYFQKLDIPLVLIPACGACNNAAGTLHVLYRGRMAEIDLGRAIARRRMGKDPDGSVIKKANKLMHAMCKDARV